MGVFVRDKLLKLTELASLPSESYFMAKDRWDSY